MPSGRRVSALVERLFGDSTPGPARRWMLWYAGVATLLAALIVARRPDAVTRPQFWAEDGYVFFYQNLTLGFPRALATFYQGFPYLAQRLIAFLGGLVPLAHAPAVYTGSAIALTALGLASFSLPGFRHLVASDGLRILFGVLALCAPFDQEVLGTPTNVSWFIAVWLSLLTLMRLPRPSWQRGSLALLGAAAILSTPLAVVNLPFWLLRAWRGAKEDRWVWLLLIGALFGAMVLTDRLGADPRTSLRNTSPALVMDWLSFVLVRLVGIVAPSVRAPTRVR